MSDAWSRTLILCFFSLTALSWSGCDSGAQPSSTPTFEGYETEPSDATQSAPFFPIPTSYVCEDAPILEWPLIDDATPNPARPGSTVELVGHGGAIRCGNAYDESSRDFDVFLEDQRIGSLNCYVNHCEGKVHLPEDLDSGDYSLRVSPDGRYTLGVQ